MRCDIPFDPNALCDICGKKGAYDLYGDHYCLDCLDDLFDNGQTEDEDDPSARLARKETHE